MRVRNKNRKGTSKELVIAVIITLLLCALMVWICYRAVEKMLWQERGTNLNNTMEKIAQCINLVMEEQWDNLDAYSNRLDNAQPETLDRAFAILARAEKERSKENIYLLLFNDRNRYYDSEGIERQWFLDGIEHIEERAALVGDFEQYEYSTEQIIFVKSLEKPLQVEGETFTHMGLVCAMDALDDAISASAYGKGSSVYIIESDGTQIYHQTRENSIFNVYNIIRAVEGYKYLYDSSWQQFRDGILNKEPGCVHFEKGSEHYIVAYHPIETGQWRAVVAIPGEMVGASTVNFAYSMMFYFFGMASTVMILLVTVIQIFDRRFRKKMQEANEQLRQAVEAEKEANVAKRRFLSHMSHDIRTPINGIIGMLNVARKHREEQEIVNNCLEKILEAANHLHSLISDVLDVSRIESGKIDIRNEEFDLVKMAEECTAIIKGHLVGREVTFTQDFESVTHTVVKGDELHLRQIIINILGNAVKFTPDGKSIRFRVSEYIGGSNRGMYYFEMEDTGIGMKPEFLKQLFEPFSQEDNGARTQYNGTGLGMAIVKQLVELLGGKIEVESTFNVGTKFVVKIPMTYRDISVPAKVGEEMNPKDILGGMSVLLVEDNEMNLEIADFILQDADINVTLARDGQEALAAFQESEQEEFDAIFMDVMMPVMDGIEATKAIRALPREDAQTIPIIAMTAKAFAEDIEITREAGMNAHLLKPVDDYEVYSTLAKYRQ